MARYTETERKLRAEYSKISRRLRQQQRRLDISRPTNLFKDTMKGEFPTLAKIDQEGGITISGLRSLLGRAKRVYRAGFLTAKKYDKSLRESVATLRENGFDFVTEENVEDMWRFINDARARGLAGTYGYSYFVDRFGRMLEDKSITPDVVEASMEAWTKYLRNYEKRVKKAAEKGQEKPKLGELRWKRKPMKKSSSNDYRR